MAAITILSVSTAKADVISINKTPVYNITSDINLITSNAENKDAYAIYDEYRAGDGAFTDDYILSLPQDASAYWLTFEVKNNNPLISNWVLNLGTPYDGTNGIANIIEVFSSDDLSKPIMRDGRHVKNKIHVYGQVKNTLPIKIKPKEHKAFLIYIDPVKGLPFKFLPKIERADHNKKQANHHIPTDKLIFGFMLIALIVTTLLTKTKNSMVPLVLFFYTLVGFTIHSVSDEIIPFGNNTGAIYIDVLYSMLAAIGLVLTGRIIARSRNIQSTEVANILNFTSCVIVTIAILGSLILVLNEFTTYINVKILPILSSIAIIAITITASKRQKVPYKELYTAAWLAFLAALIAREFNSLIENYIPLMIVHVSLLYVASLSSIAEQVKYRLRIRQETELKQEADLDIIKDREENNQTQLLKIIRREKDLLIDLKKREDERVIAINEAKDIADKANETKSEFLAVISHEIRTPMTGIMGTVKLMKDTKLDEKQTEYIDMMNKAGNTLLLLLNDILDLSKAEAGHLDIEIINFNLKEVIESVASIMDGQAQHKKLNLVVDIDPKTPNFLKGDPSRLRQILTNLVSNAIKFTKEGSITIKVTPQGKNKKGVTEIYFSVTDTGMGVPKNLQDKLFKPYSQTKTSVARKFGGTGLGLSICRKLVTAMNGTIDIKKNSKKGATFFFILPLKEGEEIKEPIAETPTAINFSTADKIKVLIVDDNNINQQVVAALLEKYMITTITVGSARDALDAIAKNNFKMIFMDMEMPEIDGIAATEMIRKLKDTQKAKTPIIAMTANNDKVSIARCIQAGMNDYINKPIDIAKLEKLTTKIIGQEQKLAKGTGAGLTSSSRDANNINTIQTNKDEKIALATEKHILNLDIFNNIKKSLPEAAFKEMIKDLYTSIEGLIADIETHIKNEDFESLDMTAHSIAGVAANFGFKALANEGKSLQKLVKSNASQTSLQNSLKKIKKLDEKTRVEVKKVIQI